jgi:hypothetical protein
MLSPKLIVDKPTSINHQLAMTAALSFDYQSSFSYS